MRPPTARFSRVAFLVIAPLALLAAQAARAQSTPPMPSFTFTPEAPVPGVPVFFTNTTPGPLTNLAWSFGDPVSGTDNHSFLPDPSHVFASGGTYNVLLTVANASGSASISRQVTVAGSGGGGGGGGACVASATRLCLNGNRFAVTSTWTTPDGATGSGNAVLLTADSGYFWFFDPTNVEVVTKVLNGCGINDAYWVFASGLTNVAVNLLVVDTQTGIQYTFDNPQGVAFPPDQATKAFPASCP